MHKIVGSLNWHACLIYLDDVLIFSETAKQHYERLRQIFECIRSSGIKLAPNKCKFMLREVKYLGHTISEAGIRTNNEKIEKLLKMKQPECEKELSSFLGFCGYYRKFIKDFATIVQPLQIICQKRKGKTKLCWNADAIASFNRLKVILTEAPILSFPNKTDKFVLDTDASDTCTGAVLSQIQNGQETVIKYASHTLSKTERQYCATRKELLAVHKYILQFRHYLWGKNF